MRGYVLGLQEIDRTQAAIVGGKGAHLGELARLEGIRVPAGFCVTTDAFRRFMAGAPWLDDPLDRLSGLSHDDREAIGALGAELREALEALAIPDELAAAITGPLARLGPQAAWAVRSSATAEDLPTASFAGQHETYLDVVGPAAVLEHVRRCWASLFTERAVTYRLRGGFDHRKIHMAVVVQQMVHPQASGVLFTADPVTSNRKVAAVEAGFGLGEALVSGLVDADTYRVRDGEIVAKAIATKHLAVHASPAGGTQPRPIEPERQQQPALTDAQVVRLVQLGRQIEAHLGRPQDIEWALVGDDFHVLQSRPITTLFPVPAVDDQDPHVYLSVGHQQMMTDPLKPLGLSVFQRTALRPMVEAGGRLFVDITRILASPAGRAGLLEVMGRSDPLTRDAVQTILERGDLVPSPTSEGPRGAPAAGAPAAEAPPPLETDPAIVTELIERSQAAIAASRRDIQAKSGAALLDFILADIQQLRQSLLEPRSHRVIMAAMEAYGWLGERLWAWLGEKNAADTLTRSIPHDVTAKMGLALLGVADVIRPHPDVVAALRRVEGEDFLDELAALEGGPEARAAIEAFLDEYGMRCVGEI
ncbi:MAG: phosphoenolpyruvate synthase, partial [Myxococcales bacterium]|nr:phosphoenolpyruvate synthase [Myxococcales bacterium]